MNTLRNRGGRDHYAVHEVILGSLTDDLIRNCWLSALYILYFQNSLKGACKDKSHERKNAKEMHAGFTTMITILSTDPGSTITSYIFVFDQRQFQFVMISIVRE